VDTIDQTISSVINQAGQFSIRYHIQDGGSTDGTLEKIQIWQNRILNQLHPIYCKNIVFTYESNQSPFFYLPQ
jgi:glycosyltransferase involved in cell wall biosynthesis